VVAFDYEGHLFQVPKPDTLTPANVVGDLLAVADCRRRRPVRLLRLLLAGLAGLQLAIRTDRLAALVMGGYPPLDGPYAQMLQVTKATHQMAVTNAASPPSTTTASPPSAESSASRTGRRWQVT
jgi:hypothetical protein